MFGCSTGNAKVSKTSKVSTVLTVSSRRAQTNEQSTCYTIKSLKIGQKWCNNVRLIVIFR